MVQVGERLEPYLRRAFSVHDVGQEPGSIRIELLAKIVGRGTGLLAQCRPGDELPVLGPLGRPFQLADGGPVALVAGGVGSAALLLMAKELVRRQLRFDFFYGGYSRVDLACRETFADLAHKSGGDFVATTEDGSFGETGLLTAPLERRFSLTTYRYVYACGPMGLLSRLAELCRRHRISGEAALETPMGCGFGACLGCAVRHVDGRYALCCKDGPVFPFHEVVW